MTAFVVVEGREDVQILRALLPSELADSAALVPAGGRSSLTSVARTLVVTHHRPVAILMDSDSRDESLVRQQRQTTEDLVKAVSGRAPVKVILFVPEIEAVFFQAPRALRRAFGEELPTDLLVMARENPKAALTNLFARDTRGRNDLSALLEVLDEEDVEALRSVPAIRELVTFLSETANRSQRTVIA